MSRSCFEILGISAGWMTGSIKNQQNEIFFSASYLTNFLDDFIVALLYLLERWPQDEIEKTSFKVEEEPAVSTWNISIEKDNFIFHAITYKTIDIKEEISNTIVTIPKDLFLYEFLEEMKEILQKFGLCGFRREWGYEFPISLYLQLVDIYKNTNALITCKKEGVDNLGSEYEATDFRMEYKYLEI